MKISSSSWKPKGYILDYPPEFVAWVDSINRNFRERKNYEPFNNYVKQANLWLKDKDTMQSYAGDHDAQTEYLTKEVVRCQTNSLYGLNKYIYVCDSTDEYNYFRYEAYDVHQIVSFLIDSGYSAIIGKPRQIFLTTTIGGILLLKVNFRLNYKCLYISDAKTKAEKLKKEKVENPYWKIPKELRSAVGSLRDTVIYFGEGRKKEKEGNNSYIEILGPTDQSAIGFSVNIIGLDEIGWNPNAGAIISQTRSTIRKFNPITKKLEWKGQFIGWGTCGRMESGGAAFEEEWYNAKTNWNEKNYEYGLIPIFFDKWARPGITQEIYDAERKAAYSYTGPDSDARKAEFHQSYPDREEDMFVRVSKSLMSAVKIQEHIDRINALKPDNGKPQYGYFDPQLDSNGKIVGAIWMPTEDASMASTIITKHPEKDWIYRYYKGTDPISSSSGPSLFASTIWDNYKTSIPAILNYRVKDYDKVFMQSLLLSLYYGLPPELLEINAGELYRSFIEDKGYGHIFIGNKALPPYLQTGSQDIGIYNSAGAGHGGTAGYIINKAIEMLGGFADNINIMEFFHQLRTFEEKITPKGNATWQARDKRFDKDDTIYSSTYAYIAACCYPGYLPKKIGEEEINKPIIKRYMDDNGNIRLGQFNSKGDLIGNITYEDRINR
jgi:hypothetical protein